jgi:flagellar biosynthesis protein FlhG
MALDQASPLRRLASLKRLKKQPSPPLRTFAVTSGKGGVGKTNLVVNLSLELTRLRRRVLLIDADLGLANVDVILGLNTRYTINDVIKGRKNISDVVVKGPGGMNILPGASGVSELSSLGTDEKLLLLQQLDSFETQADTVVVDTAAGISDMVLYFNIAVQDRLVVATGEPTSLTDAYALIKVLFTKHQERRFKLIVNNVRDATEAKQVYRKLATAAEHFLGGVSLDYLGFIPKDPAVTRSVMMQKPVVLAFPNSPASHAFKVLAKRLLSTPVESSGGNIKFFWRRLVDMA